MFKPWLTVGTAIAAATLSVPAIAAEPAGKSCDALTALRIPDVRITAATVIKPEPVWMAPLTKGEGVSVPVKKSFCRVEGVIEDEIGFELWLPEGGGWNGRMLGVGNGGFAGFIRYDGLARGVNNGFATASTDTGHKISEVAWPIGQPRRLENYGHRGQHLLAVNAKKIVAAFYGNAAHHHYFMGCSGGGMQAMNEVQRYPADYDGIIAGSHGRSIVGISARWLTSGLTALNDPVANLTAADWRRVADAAIRQCDTLDGVADGIINNPRQCRFDIATTPGLSAQQAAFAKKLYGPILAPDGYTLFPGFDPGVSYSPLTSTGRAGEVFAQWYYGDANWDFRQFDQARDLALTEAAVPGASFTNPNLEAFMRRGGKLISQHGWTDQIVPTQATIDYYDSVAHFLGQEKTNSFYRLYLPPGVDHCRGGTGPDNFGTLFYEEPPVMDARHDMLTAIVEWVEKGIAPQEIIASKLKDGKVTMQRPICPYPQVAKYSGRGDTNDAANFRCVKS